MYCFPGYVPIEVEVWTIAPKAREELKLFGFHFIILYRRIIIVSEERASPHFTSASQPHQAQIVYKRPMSSPQSILMDSLGIRVLFGGTHETVVNFTLGTHVKSLTH